MEASEPSASGARARKIGQEGARIDHGEHVSFSRADRVLVSSLARLEPVFFYDRCDDKVPSRLLADWPFVVCCCFLTDDRRIRGRAWPRRIECWSAGRFNPRLRTSPWPLSAPSTPGPIHGARARANARHRCAGCQRVTLFFGTCPKTGQLYFFRG